MKILFVTGLTGFGIGGARTEEIRLVRGIADRGNQVGMCSDVLAGELAGTPHFKLDYPPAEKAPEQLAKALKEFQPDLIHVVGGGVRFLADCSRGITQTPWVFTAHNVPPAERIFPRLYANTALHYAVRNVLAFPNVWSWRRYLATSPFRAAICHSATVGKRLAKVGCPADKIREIPFGSELPEQALTPDPEGCLSPAGMPGNCDPEAAAGAKQPEVFPSNAWPKIVTVAGLAFHKGQLDGIRMAAKLLPDFPKLQYRLIGMTRDKRYRAYLEKTIASSGLSQHVRIIHSAPEVLKFAALREADLYVQPSHEEGFCIAFLEAAMLSPRLIGGDTGAIAAMAAGDPAARVVPPGDVAGLVQAAHELLARNVEESDVNHRREVLKARYSWDAYLDAHLSVYRDLLSARSS